MGRKNWDSLRFLHLEDSAIDAELIRERLEQQWPDCRVVRVETEADFIRALERSEIDLILADYSLPTFDGLSALAIVRERFPEIPFIFVSGTIGEVVAIETLKSGATDYVLKNGLSRLGPSIRRALQERDDLRERNELENQLRHAQKMEAIGTLAGGVAHDFNNILTAMIGYCSLLQMNGLEELTRQEYLSNLLSTCEKAANLTQGLLTFSRKQSLELKAVNLADIIRSITKLIKRLIGEDIAVDIELPLEPLTIMADFGQVEQVIMNLATNARHAMPAGGRLTISAETAIVEHAPPNGGEAPSPGSYALLRVADTGSGMDRATLSRIFEPFFTTKEVGVGTGLGLSIIYGIVKQHGAYITVESAPGRGTTFSLYFPLLAQQRDEAPQAVRTPIPGGTETILLVEDDPSVRSLIRSVLTQAGYGVIEADSGAIALECHKLHRDRIGLVLLDLIMPAMGGSQVYDEIVRDSPRTRVLFMSGYSAEIIKSRGLLPPGANFLAKPIAPADLLRRIRTILDQPPHPDRGRT